MRYEDTGGENITPTSNVSQKELQKDIRKAIFFDDVEAFRKNFLDKHYVYSMGMVFSCAVIPVRRWILCVYLLIVFKERRRPGHALGHHHDERCFRQVAEFFGIWHESGRSSYKGTNDIFNRTETNITTLYFRYWQVYIGSQQLGATRCSS